MSKRRALRAGRAIGVVVDVEGLPRTLRKAKLLRGGGSIKLYYRLTQAFDGARVRRGRPATERAVPFFVSHVLARDEGVTWVRDWNSAEADALRAVLAL